ncbi:MAG: redoxin domain-containing protein, partial [Phycisphaerales bacterium]
IDGKRILVCFWDMQQRPSRYCVTQLAKQAQQLKDKGVVIVAVQASKMDQTSLAQWARKYKIPFPVGMVQRSFEKARFSWGIQSLPWLILTDTQHVIRSAGFPIKELNEKLKQIDDG